MDGPIDYHTKVRKGQIPYDIPYRWNLKYDTTVTLLHPALKKLKIKKIGMRFM